MGWYYDESMPRQEYFYQIFEKILCKYPNLRIAAAHMGFYANRLDIASRLLENCPNMYFDITPAIIIYLSLIHILPDSPLKPYRMQEFTSVWSRVTMRTPRKQWQTPAEY